MRILLPLVTLLFSTLMLTAQPANDDCENAIDLGISPNCDTTILYNNLGATPSNVGRHNLPPCFKGGASNNDIWFKFTTSDALEYYFDIQGIPDSTINDTFGLFNPEAAIYAGSCDTNDLTLLNHCFSAPNGVNNLSFTLDDLADNTTYYLRINANGFMGINNGSFKLCLTELDDKFRIDEKGSDLCQGRVYDTGGDSSHYGNNEDFIFTICPQEPNECLILTMGNYELEMKAGDGDYFKIYDGKDTTGSLIGGSIDMRDTSGKSFLPGRNNAVCQSFMARSGCLTILWHTDSTLTADGFDATWICTPDSCPVFDTLQIETGGSNAALAESVTGRLLSIDIDSINCVDSAFGIFYGDNTDLGLDKGLLLTTGRADAVAQANTYSNMGFKNDTSGISLLDSLSAKIYGDSTFTHDGCSIGMEILPETDVMALEITLGSEEYPECLMDQLTDIMGLFYTTSGFTGDPLLDNHINIAVVPFDTVDIQISTINPNDSTRWSYYRNTLNSQSFEYDGMIANGNGGQKFLMLTQNVEPCQANHLIAAIADRGDSLYDSGIFISNIRCLTPEMSFQSSTGLPFFIETCNPGDDFITVNFPRTYTSDTEWSLSFSGSATFGSDYTWTHGNTIVQPAGEKSVRYPIDVIDDGIEEGSESISIKLSRDWGCGEVELTELEIEIRDKLIAEIQADDIACKGDSFVLIATGDLGYLNMSWSPRDLFDNPDLNREVIIAEQNETIILTGTIIGTAGCTWSDTFNLRVVDPQVQISTQDPTGICLGESVELTAHDNVSGSAREWSPNVDITSTNARSVTVTPKRTTRYFVMVDTAGCKARDSIDIVVDILDFPDVIADTTICAGESIQLANETNSSRSTYLWSPPLDLDDPTTSGPIAMPGDTITYYLQAMSRNGYCRDSAQVTISVIDVDVDIIGNQDTIFICAGDTTILTAITRGSGEISWVPAVGVIGSSSNPELVVSPENTTTYVVTFTSERCSPTDRITVAVDRLPEDEISIDPNTSPYCLGDTINLSLDISNIIPRGLSFDWSGSNIVSGEGTEQITLVANEATDYSVKVVNGVCEDVFDISFEVLAFTPTLTPDSIDLCRGDSVVLAGNEPNDSLKSLYNISYSWSSSNDTTGVFYTDSDTNVINVVVGNGATVYYTVQIENCAFETYAKVSSSYVGQLSFTVFPDSIADCQEVSVTVDLDPSKANATIDMGSIEWTYIDSLGNISQLSSNGLSVTHFPTLSGRFRLSFEDSNGCSHEFFTDPIYVLSPVIDKIPNVFSPNRDGMNDLFHVLYQTSVEYEISSFRVYNRWGNLIFEDNSNDGWDGRINGGEDAQEDVYLYVIEFNDACGNGVKPLTGDVTLIR